MFASADGDSPLRVVTRQKYGILLQRNVFSHRIYVPNKRATFIVAEPLPYEGLSSRKLVLETAYFNVLTAYEPDEAIDILSRFPNADAVILHSELYRDKLPQTIAALKKIRNLAVFVVAAGQNVDYSGADEVVSSHSPQELLTLVTERFGGERAEETRKKAS